MKKKKVLATAALLLCLIVSIGTAAAYFTDYESAKGGAVVHLKGQTEMTEEMDGNHKILKITNTGETDMIVRAIIIGDAGRIQSIAGDGWSEGADGAYYYGKVLHPGEGGNGDATTQLRVNVRGGDSDTDDFEIIVVHEGSRAVYAGSGKPGEEGQKLTAPDGWDADAVAKIRTK